MTISALTRTGRRPLEFEGELLASAKTQSVCGQGRNRWFALGLYRSRAGQYVLAIGYRTEWQGELNHDTAEILSEIGDVETELRLYDPCQHVIGFPHSPQYEARQEALFRALMADYEHAISELLEQFPEQLDAVE